jgi:hypothetical protein
MVLELTSMALIRLSLESSVGEDLSDRLKPASSCAKSRLKNVAPGLSLIYGESDAFP